MRRVTGHDDFRDSLGEVERVRKPKGCFVIWMDRRLLIRDFPFLEGVSDKDMERWLVENAGWISLPQSRANEVNERVDVGDELRVARRPARYGRAVVMEVSDLDARAVDAGSAGMVDIKGAGVGCGRVPRLKMDSTGVVTVIDAIVEILFQKVIERVCSVLGESLRCVGLYGLLCPGFWVRTLLYRDLPAVLIARRAHRRTPGNVDIWPRAHPLHIGQLAVEMYLRQFGLTSSCRLSRLRLAPEGSRICISYGGRERVRVQREDFLRRIKVDGFSDSLEIDCINIQMSRQRRDGRERYELHDFGHYLVRDRFERPVLSLVEDAPLNWGTFIGIDSEEFVQPIDEFGIDPAMSREQIVPTHVGRWMGRERLRGASAVGAAVAAGIGTGSMSRSDVENLVDEYVDHVTRNVPLCAGSARFRKLGTIREAVKHLG